MKHEQFILMLAAAMGLVVLPVNAAPFCGGESAQTRVDLRTGEVRDAAPTETLTYTVNYLNGGAKGASVDITVNGASRWQGLAGRGRVEWMLSAPGTNTLRQIVKDASGGEVTNYTARFVTTRQFVPTVTTPVANTTRKIYVDGVEAVKGMVLSNETATVVYTADEGYMFESGETVLTFALDTTKSPAVTIGWRDPGALVRAWQEELTLAVDTRMNVVIFDPQEVLPIAYSTNFWATTEASRLGDAVSVSVIDPSGSMFRIVPTTNVNGFAEWRPAVGAFGKYTLRHSVSGAVTFDTSAVIHYLDNSQIPVTYYAMGGRHADGSETKVVQAAVATGYAFPAKAPTRDNFAFDGWFRTWSNRHARVTALDVTASPVQPLAAHGLYAQWTPVSTKVTDGDIAIPDITNGVPVLSIGAFDYAQATHPSQRFETLVTPLYLQSIGKGAFQGVTTLKTLIITPSRSFDDPRLPVPLAIGQKAFASCLSLEEVRIPGEVSFIDRTAFANCARLKRIVFTGTNAVAYGEKAFYRCGYENGEGELKVYMRKEFKASNAGLLADFANWNTAIKVVPLVGVSPATGEAPTIAQSDFGNLATDRRVALLVKVPTLISGAKPDVSAVTVKYSSDLSVWSTLVPEAATAAEDGTVLVEFALPEGNGGFFKVEVR